MHGEQFNKLLTGSHPLNAETAEELKAMVIAYPTFQLGWLLYLKNLKDIGSDEFDSVLKKVAVRISNRKLMYQFLNSEIKKVPLNNEFEKSASSVFSLEREDTIQPGESLIDKFLQSDHSVIRNNLEEDQSASNDDLKRVVEKSNVENQEIITETLANIYFQQKNYEKAQDAFNKLSLKYPEKSVYFATRIKEIEDIKNK